MKINKRVVAVLFLAVPLTLSVTACDPFGQQASRDAEQARIDRMDRLYKECIDAGGSFSKHTGWATDYSCTMPGEGGNIDVEVNANTKE